MTAPFADNPVHLSEDEQATLQQWVDDAKRQLALSDWSITVSRHQVGGSALAQSFVRDHADISVVAFSAECREWDAEEMRQNLIHELLHPHFQRITRLSDKLIENELGRRTEAVIWSAINEIEEQSIDRLATAVARFLPLPTWPVEAS